jgi:chromosome segregation ATPase
VTNASKGKSEKSVDLDPLESVFGQLERRVEALASRLKAALEENGKLKTAAATAAAERKALEAQIAEAKKAASKGDDAATRLKAYEAERAEVRTRIERLIASLEGA